MGGGRCKLLSAARATRVAFATTAGDQAFSLRLFACKLLGSADRFGLFACSFFGRFFIRPAALHFAEHALALHLLFQDPEGLIDIVVSDENFQGYSPSA